ncbi:MAG: PHP domain-containing protein [Bacillota bacterium]
MGAGRFDLHVHTTASDGTWSPARVVGEAARLGLAGVGITDHDTVAGLPEALAAGERAGIRVVPGIELGSEYGGEEVHVLGYFIDPGHPRLAGILTWLQEVRWRRLDRMVERVAELGLPVSRQRVAELAAGGTPGRPHLARAMVEAGYVGSVEEAFDRYLERGRPGYVPRPHLSPSDAVRVIRQAGGCAVLAHPGLLRDDGVIAELVGAGLGGIEARYPKHRPEQVEEYGRLGRRLGLIVTGGSDFHGPGVGPPAWLGEVTVPADVVEALAHRARGGGGDSGEERREGGRTGPAA